MTLAHTLLVVFYRTMSTASTILTPLGVRGMKILEREKFFRKIQTPVLKVPAEKLSKITPNCKDYFLKLENFKPVQNDSDNKHKCIFFNPDKIGMYTDIAESHRQGLLQVGVTENNFELKDIQLSYENWSYGTIFKAVLPENEDIVSGFTQVGHIIHLNLKDHLLEYRSLIGQVFVDKIKSCRTVVNKSSIIDNTYRNFSMEVIAGEEDFIVTVKENQCNFMFNFSKVYWNSRLGQEHERILGFVKPGDVLFDIFCGVGPFAIPAVKKKCKVFANDLNPDSFKWLNHNAKLNKLNMSLFKSYNLDGKDFIINNFKEHITDYCLGKEKLEKGAKLHITMNLPAIAVEFLKYFNGLIEDQSLAEKLDFEIIVYVYCFAPGEDVMAAKTMVIENIGCDISDDIIDIYDVRNVSPKKEMIRVTFRLCKKVLFSVRDSVSEPPKKKLCLENE
ncbi:tRNA (guanine(37)-N1)-methyltransferase [Cydia splendana]|uniref:tRNA (guanine(37)-N1)-methyltransferase n=1 Tax=Cydia splendana TaxID=1100963 RepID=UPI00300D2BA7